MLLSRIKLDPGKNHMRRAISAPSMIHAAIEGCFPDKMDKDRKLWRLDRLQGSLFLLLLSPEMPDFSELARQFCAEGVQGETKDYTPLLSSIRVGGRYRFRLRANPTHSVPMGKGERGKVFSHVTVEQKRDWLMQKARAGGFMLEESLFDVVETDHLRFARGGKGSPVEIGVAVYEGVLEVSDREMLVRSLTQGIGRAKAYGCGLLTVVGLR